MNTATEHKQIEVTISVEVDPADWNEAKVFVAMVSRAGAVAVSARADGADPDYAATRRDIESYLLNAMRESPMVVESGASVAIKK